LITSSSCVSGFWPNEKEKERMVFGGFTSVEQKRLWWFKPKRDRDLIRKEEIRLVCLYG
jgi:hypothetical protein